MPIPAPIIAALIGAGVTGTTTGLEASGAIGGSSGPSAAQLQQQQAEAQQKAQQTQEQLAFRRFAPDAQATTGGALADPAFASMVSELSGAPQDINLAQQTLFGTQPGLSTGGAQ